MASTIVRVHGLRPVDIEVRKAVSPSDEVVLCLGDTVAVQGTATQLKLLLRLADARIDQVEGVKPPRIGEPF